MKRLINFSGPLVEARGHAHAGPGNERDARAYALSSILGPLAMPRGEQFLKGPRVHRITRLFPLLFHTRPDRPFHSISCIYLCSRSTAARLGYSSLERSSLVRTADATHTTVHTPEVLFCATLDKVELPCDTVSPVPCSRLNGIRPFDRRTISRGNSFVLFPDR